jgi:hypothetical protein
MIVKNDVLTKLKTRGWERDDKTEIAGKKGTIFRKDDLFIIVHDMGHCDIKKLREIEVGDAGMHKVYEGIFKGQLVSKDELTMILNIVDR